MVGGSICRLRHLAELDIGTNMCELGYNSVGDSTVSQLMGLPLLSKVGISIVMANSDGTKVTRKGLQRLCGLEQGGAGDTGNNNYGDEEAVTISRGLQNARDLSVSENNIGWEGVGMLAKSLTKLSSLRIQDNE